nr:phosphoribosylformylglycinamidine cyclo-ligase [Gammaproteobacteria bacterium]NIX86962.1 phosphoribosylformylglycinamidine cyclo-ligase [Gammaproteobacteria bacterium]
VVCVAEQDGHAAVELLHELGEVAWPIGSIETASGGERVVLR